MALRRIKYLIPFFLLGNVFSKSSLPELLTKQSIENIRFISNDGKFTYYQKNSGDLIFSTNYSVKTILKSPKGTQYFLSSSPHKKFITIEKDETFHSYLGVRKLYDIFVISYGKKDIKSIGQGRSAQLHNNDDWVSFYNPHTKNIHFENIANNGKSFKILLYNKYNPYFIPEVIFIDQDIYYTDINEEGFIGLLHFKRTTEKTSIIYKAEDVSKKISLCYYNKKFYVSLTNVEKGQESSEISLLDVTQKTIWNDRKILYTSQLNDPGHIACKIDENIIYFSKNLSTAKKDRFEIVEFDPRIKKEKILTDLEYATHLIEMDGRLLAPFRGKFYVLLGDSNLKNIDIINQVKKNDKKN